ncbi:MAG: bifunctional ADP-dependent NAD(P)H-hydrate dehydratase/NAD(P)H-hydrate epimerase [Nitratiruptor sp.]|nr:bifunctional ADP-dependent NAD(P)H-hydrate dehydratase/NAD(P)H-hydrate epimerase [Nitratiruptor sp.]NPA83410.1 NAD(P)H-hydrate dehydratase [Campylobacterota bacterium]
MRNLYEDVGPLDRRCYETFKLSEDLLMEHAATGLAQEVRKHGARRVLIVAGPGNNGGDGIAAARQLLGECQILLYLPFGAKSPMAQLQLERYQAAGGELVSQMEGADLIVDALFGSGLTRPLNEESLQLIQRLNQMEGFKIACDIPSGIDRRGVPLPQAFRADVTITMGAPKLALFNDLAKDFVGQIQVVDLGVSSKLYEVPSQYKLLEAQDLHPPYRVRQNVNKGDFGHLVLIAGEKEGAAIMAALAALRFGTGLVTVVRNEPLTIPYELMYSSSLPPKCSALAVGMGLGLEYSDAEFEALVLQCHQPMVIDADLFYSPKILQLLERPKIVLTPHPKEFAALLQRTGLGTPTTSQIQEERFSWALRFAQAYPHAVLLLKGANPIIAHGSQLYVNPLGTNALAKGGSGDVLTGLIGALLAQGYEPLEAAIQGSLAHALAARKVPIANYALTPSDLIEALKEL